MQVSSGEYHALGIQVTGPVSILPQPSDRLATAGDEVLFSTPAIGQLPVSYQWRLNSVPISGQTSSPLALANVQTNDSGSYDVVVKNAFGAVTSQVATLTVSPTPPIITLNPFGVAASLGGNASFTAFAKGSAPISLQWQCDSNNVPGATNETLTLTALNFSNSGLYQLVASNAFGQTISAAAPLQVVPVFAWGGTDFGVLALPMGLTNVTALSAGYNHSLALTADGTVIGWGDDGWNEISAIEGYTNVAAISAADEFSVILLDDGTVVAAGDFYAAPGDTNVCAIAAGENYCLLLRSNGTVFAWGEPFYYPVPPTTATNLVAIAAGGIGNLGLRADGSVMAWGSGAAPPISPVGYIAISSGYNYSLGLRTDGTVTEWSAGPVPAAATNIVAIATGYSHAMALRDDGQIIVWGTTNTGQAVIPAALTFAVSIAAGNNYDLALMGVGPVNFSRQPVGVSPQAGYPMALASAAAGAGPISYQWMMNGSNIPGATHAYYSCPDAQAVNTGEYQVVASNNLGAVTSCVAAVTVIPCAPVLTQVPTNQQSEVGGTGSFAATAVGTEPITYQWQLDGLNIPNATNSSLLLTNISLVNAGNYSVAVSNSAGGTVGSYSTLVVSPVVAWGAGMTNSNISPNFGQSLIPVATSNAVAIAGGGYHSLALQAGGMVTAWGFNAYGETNVPASLTNAAAIAGGLYHSMALRSNGTVSVWGLSSYGITTVPAAATNVTAIAAGWYHCLALQSNGMVVAWGAGTTKSLSPNYGQCIVPTNLTGVIAVAAGGYHSIALRTNGTVIAWGLNSSGQTNVPPGLSNVVAIAATAATSIALKSDGTLVGWGDNSFGQKNFPSGLSNVVAISAGAGHVMALESDGTLVIWGSNANGQTNIPTGLTNVVAIAAGGYHSLALLNFTMQPSIDAIAVQAGGSVTINFNSTPVAPHRLWMTSDFSPPVVWSPIATSITSGDGTGQLTDTTTQGIPMRFYSVSLP